MILRFSPQDAHYRSGDFVYAENAPDSFEGRVVQVRQFGDYTLDDGDGCVLDEIPNFAGFDPSAFMGFPVEKTNAKRFFVLRRDTARDAQYLRRVPTTPIGSYLVREVLVQFEQIAGAEGFAQPPERLETLLRSGPRNEGTELWDDLTRVNFIEVRVEPRTWENVFFTSTFVGVEQVGSEVEILPIVGKVQTIEFGGLSSQSMPAIVFPRDVPPAFNWLRPPNRA